MTAGAALSVPAGRIDWSVRTLQALLPDWTRQPIGLAPANPSYVADDGFPAEMSVNWSGSRPELRLLFDSLDDSRFDVVRSTAATRRWGQIHGVFAARDDTPAAPLWYSVAWRPPAEMAHKTYFGLYAWPLERRYAAVDEAMAHLGMSAAWADARRHVDDAAGQREIEFLAVDLIDKADARVKIYYRNHDADLGEVDRIASVARHHDAERALAAYKTLAGDRTDAGEAALTCLAFRTGLTQVAESTTYLRLSDLAPDDEQAVDRTATLLGNEGIDPARLRTLVAALAARPLHDSRGLLALVSYRSAGRQGDITTYFRFPVYGRP